MRKIDKILWLGTFAYGQYFEELLLDGTYVQTAANRVQEYYLKELESSLNINIEVISALVTQSYKKSPRKKLESNYTMLSRNITIENISFLNYSFINIISQKIEILKRISKWCKINQDKKIWVIVYSMRLPLLEAARLIKKKLPNACIVNIIPDLPMYMHSAESKIRNLLSIPYFKAMKKCQKNIDGFVLYTKNMRDEIMCNDRNSIVIEGLFDINNCVSKTINKKNKNNPLKVLYAGGLEEKYGIKNLVEAFSQIDDLSCELHLYGSGSLKKYINEVSKIKQNIKYMGIISPDKVYEKMKEADLLVNPRPVDEFYTNYSFPSKTFEYMASGTPVLMTKLSGIPEEYFKYVYIIEDDSIEGITIALKKYFSCSVSDRYQKANEAKEFICNKKNTSVQVGKLINFFYKLSREDIL